MALSEIGYLFMLVIGCLALVATVAVIVSAHSRQPERESAQVRAWQ